MRLIGARQAWHDALYDSGASALAVAAERAVLGKRGYVANETMPSRRETNGRCAHMLASGLVQQAIASLPKPLQHFGHALYSPVGTGQDLNIAHSLVWFSAEGLPEMTPHKQKTAFWLALAALRSYQGIVLGREPWSPTRACEFVRDWYGAKVVVANWARDWDEIWQCLMASADRLDVQALKPVAELVARMGENRAA